MIYDFYDVIEEIVTTKKLDPSQIWNADKTGFPMDPQKSKVIAPVGEVGFTITGGAGRENTTILGVCNGADRVLDPLIIFQGKNLHSTWQGNKALPKTFYGVSEKGWMTTGIFADWFKQFVKEVKERPLLIWDGHMTHVSTDLVKAAKKEDVTIVKYPPHVTDQLQPLDVTCFGPLKRKWESLLNEWVVEWGSKLTKANFVNLLSKVWHEGLKPSNVVSGFRTTGIFPVDREKYKKSRLDPRLLKRYDNWVRLGKPEDIMEDLATAVNSPKKVFTGTENENRNETEEQPNISFKITLPGSSTSSPNSACQNSSIQDHSTSSTNLVQQDLNCSICNELGTKPVNVPGHKWVPVWSLQKIEQPKSNNQTNTSFAEAILNKMKGRADKPAPVKRRKVDMTTKVISDEAYLETLDRYEREDEEKQKRKSILEQKRKNKKTRKKLTYSKSESDENMEKKDISLPLEDSTEEEVEESDDEMNESNLEELYGSP